MRLATQEELNDWDTLIANNPDGGNALQTSTWGDFKSRWGWQPRRYIYEISGGRKVAVSWLCRSIPVQGDIWYCPKGPGVTTKKDLIEIINQTKTSGISGVFARFESEVEDDSIDKSKLISLGMVRANRDPGSKSTIFIDLKQGEDKLLASFNQSARRNIRKAYAGDVVAEPVESTPDNLDTMYDLMRATESRAHYGLRPKAYFLDYWSSQSAAGQGQLFFAKCGNEVLAGVFVTYVGERSWYKDGGSFDLKRELHASYLIQWEVMRWLIKKQVKQYDMLGTPNRDAIGSGDSRDGLYAFKSKFNPEVTEFAGCWDLPLNSIKYRLWRSIGERIAARSAAKSPERFLY